MTRRPLRHVAPQEDATVLGSGKGSLAALVGYAAHCRRLRAVAS